MSNKNSNVVLFHWAAKERERKKCLLEWKASISCLIQSIYFCIICMRYFKRTNIFKATVTILLPSHNLFSASNQMLYPTTLQKYAEHSYISSVKMSPTISFFYLSASLLPTVIMRNLGRFIYFPRYRNLQHLIFPVDSNAMCFSHG